MRWHERVDLYSAGLILARNKRVPEQEDIPIEPLTRLQNYVRLSECVVKRIKTIAEVSR